MPVVYPVSTRLTPADVASAVKTDSYGAYTVDACLDTCSSFGSSPAERIFMGNHSRVNGSGGSILSEEFLIRDSEKPTLREAAVGAGRIGFIDERDCLDQNKRSVVGCGIGIVGIVPIGKIAKGLGVGADAAKAAKAAGGAADTASDLGRSNRWAPNVIAPNTVATGGRSRVTWGFGNTVSEAQAADAYAAIRASTTDVRAIARYQGLNERSVVRLTQMKGYLFNNPAWTGPDAEIAAAWHRLRTGPGTFADKQLLRHETAEMWYRANVSDDYGASHAAANRLWNWQSLVGGWLWWTSPTRT